MTDSPTSEDGSVKFTEPSRPKGRRIPYLPTPKQIRAECLKIQSEWTEKERIDRAGFSHRQWNVPQISVDTDAGDL